MTDIVFSVSVLVCVFLLGLLCSSLHSDVVSLRRDLDALAKRFDERRPFAAGGVAPWRGKQWAGSHLEREWGDWLDEARKRPGPETCARCPIPAPALIFQCMPCSPLPGWICPHHEPGCPAEPRS